MKKEVYEFISEKTKDPILEWRTCRASGEVFPVFKKDQEILKKLSPEIGWKIHELPLPVYAPLTRHRLHLMYKNERHLYHDVCWLTWQKTITRIHPEVSPPTFTTKAWASDDRDYTDYGLSYDGQNPLDLINNLAWKTPYQDLIWSLSNLSNNSTYTNYTADVVNCYLLFDSNTTQDSAYCTKSRKCQSVFDCTNIINCEKCYGCVDCWGLFECTYSYDSSDCSHSHYLIDCHGCNYCIWCVNLVNKEYHIFNQPVSKETFASFKQKLIANRRLLSHPHWTKLQQAMIKKATHGNQTEKSIGENIRGSSDCILSYNIVNAQSLRYCDDMSDAQDCRWVTSYGHASSRMYNSSQVGRYTSQVRCSSTIGRGENLLYCIDTKKSKNCFGCVNMKQKEYCIFNKQYTREEYEDIVPHIIESMKKSWTWWHFLPSSCTVFPYNDSVANDQYPIHTLCDSKGNETILSERGSWKVTLLEEWVVVDALLDLGWEEKRPIKRRTQEVEINMPPDLQTLAASALPNTISAVTNDILTQAIVCSKTQRPFRVVPMELEFYREMWLPLPQKHPDIRHQERISIRAWREFHLRKCEATGEEIVSVYPWNSNFKVYSDAAYQQAIYW